MYAYMNNHWALNVRLSIWSLILLEYYSGNALVWILDHCTSASDLICVSKSNSHVFPIDR